MSDFRKLETNVDAPPERPFYEERKAVPKRKGSFSPRTAAWHERKRQELRDELAKPKAQRAGGLRSAIGGDFSPEELKAIEERYGMKVKPADLSKPANRLPQMGSWIFPSKDTRSRATKQVCTDEACADKPPHVKP